jgi:hypothetical protein
MYPSTWELAGTDRNIVCSKLANLEVGSEEN